jgi:hypothetical protein
MLSLYRILSLISIAALGAGAAHIARYGSRRRVDAPAPLQTWEAEGGAVPVGPTQTAAQVAPRERAETPNEAAGPHYH